MPMCREKASSSFSSQNSMQIEMALWTISHSEHTHTDAKETNEREEKKNQQRQCRIEMKTHQQTNAKRIIKFVRKYTIVVRPSLHSSEKYLQKSHELNILQL